MYCYCDNDPINFSDPSGMAYENTMTWTSSMWWLTLADGPVPVGDILYGIGIAGIAIFDTISMIGSNDTAVNLIAMGPDAIADAVNNLSNWYQKTISGSSSPAPGDPNWRGGFKNFSQLKKYLGSPGKGNQWHHIVEQSQIKKSGFDTYNVNNINNVMPLPKEVHKAVSAYYSSKPGGRFGSMTVRDWLAGKSFDFQYKFGLEIVAKAMKGIL